jgi:PAS domain S-box-containing protein
LTKPDLHRQLAALTLDALSAHVAVLNGDGVILLVNSAWRKFAAANAAVSNRVSEGANYLAVCDAAQGRDSQGAAAFAERIRDVLNGSRGSFELEYPCLSPHETRWFLGRVTRLADADATGVVIAHENITDRKLAEIARSESQVNLRSFFESTVDMVLVWSFHGKVLYSNNVLRQRLGYSEQELSVMQVLELRPSVGTRPTAGIFAPEHDIPVQGSPLQLAAKDGSLVEVSTRVWPGEWDGTDCIFWLSQDLTVEQEAQRRFESLFARDAGLN